MKSSRVLLLALVLSFCLPSILANDADDADDGGDTCTDAQVDDFIWPPPYNYYLNDSESFTIIELPRESGARCSDGSMFKLYYAPGYGDGAKKFMVFFPGGGYCGDDNTGFLYNCLVRSLTFEGSSTFSGDNGTTTSFAYSLGYFSSNVFINPLFANWHKVYLPYCDGIIFQGYREEPYNYNGTQFWFRGYNNTKSTFEYMRDSLGLFDAEEVMITGISAGGQAVFMWLNWIQKFLPSTIKLRALTDAGLFMDIVNQNAGCHLFRKQMMDIANYTLSNQTAHPSRRG